MMSVRDQVAQQQWACNRDRDDSPESLLVNKCLPVNHVYRYIAQT